jgi:ubiquitin carboxyl-terminal hydrolase 3
MVISDPPIARDAATGKSTKGIVNLEDCIDLFSSAEELESSASATASADSSSSETASCRSCLACGSDSGFSKAFRLGALPRVLCFHLKRFRWKQNTIRGTKQKVDTFVRFPLENLDMGRWLGNHDSRDEDLHLYNLYAVVIHQGSG